MNRIIVLTCFAFIIAISGCSQNSTTPIKVSKYGKIIGLVRTVDGVPIQDAEISTTPPSDALVSDVNGRFIITSLTEGVYTINANKKGYKTKSVSVNVTTNNETQAIIILEEISIINNSPAKPTLISPANSSSTSGDIKLQWDCTDPENDELSYNVYFGESISVLIEIASNLKSKEYLVTNIATTSNRTYYWRVEAIDAVGNKSESDIWSFVTTSSVDPSDLLLYIPFDGSLTDRSPMMQVWTQNNISIVNDRFGKQYSAAYFSGTSYISIDQPKNMDFSKPFTVALWVKPDAGYGIPYDNEVDLISRYGAASPNTSSFSFLISDAHLSGEVYKFNVGRNVLIANAIVVNQWQHVAFVYDGTDIKLYFNGTMNASKTSYQPDKSNLPLLIGKRSTNNRFFKGYMDDIMVYGKALSDSDIFKLSQQ